MRMMDRQPCQLALQLCVPREQLGADDRYCPQDGGCTEEHPEARHGHGQHAPGARDPGEAGPQPLNGRLVRVNRQRDVRRIAELVPVGVDARHCEGSHISSNTEPLFRSRRRVMARGIGTMLAPAPKNCKGLATRHGMDSGSSE